MDGSELTGRNAVVALGVAVLVAGAVGALVGSVLVGRGIEEVTVLEISVTVSPAAVAAYGAVTVGTFLATLAFVAEAIARFDDQPA